MSSEKLTQKALEQHDNIFAKLQATTETTNSHGKENLNNVKGQAKQLIRRDSNKMVANITNDQISSHLERKISKSLLLTPRPTAGLSFFRVVQAARAWKRLSQRNQTIPERPKPRLENTYKLGPDPEKNFKPEKVKVVIQDILTRLLTSFRYTAEGAKQMCLNVSSEIKSRVKRMEFPRYKIVCNVIIMQNKGQGSEISSRCIWNPETDSYASMTFKTGQIICVASVHAVYFE